MKSNELQVASSQENQFSTAAVNDDGQCSLKPEYL